MIIGVAECRGGGSHSYRWVGMDTVKCTYDRCEKVFTGHQRKLGTDRCLTCKRDHPNK